MLGARSSTSALNDASSGDEHQLQDLESLAQRIRALETLLAPPAVATTSGASAARASGSNSGIGAGASSSSLSNGNESPIEDSAGTGAGAEDSVNTSSSSSNSPRRVGGDPYQVQHHPSRNHHHNQEQNVAAGSLSRRIQKIETRLWAAAKERKPTEEFLQKCKFFSHFLLFFIFDLKDEQYPTHPDKHFGFSRKKTKELGLVNKKKGREQRNERVKIGEAERMDTFVYCVEQSTIKKTRTLELSGYNEIRGSPHPQKETVVA